MNWFRISGSLSYFRELVPGLPYLGMLVQFHQKSGGHLRTHIHMDSSNHRDRVCQNPLNLSTGSARAFTASYTGYLRVTHCVRAMRRQDCDQSWIIHTSLSMLPGGIEQCPA